MCKRDFGEEVVAGVDGVAGGVVEGSAERKRMALLPADEETQGAVGGFGDADAWGGLDFGGTVAVVGDSDGGGG